MGRVVWEILKIVSRLTWHWVQITSYNYFACLIKHFHFPHQSHRDITFEPSFYLPTRPSLMSVFGVCVIRFCVSTMVSLITVWISRMLWIWRSRRILAACSMSSSFWCMPWPSKIGKGLPSRIGCLRASLLRLSLMTREHARRTWRWSGWWGTESFVAKVLTPAMNCGLVTVEGKLA